LLYFVQRSVSALRFFRAPLVCRTGRSRSGYMVSTVALTRRLHKHMVRSMVYSYKLDAAHGVIARW
jgi:hypothetical protein